MKRVWLSISMLVVTLVGLQWLGNPARGEGDDPCPSVDAGYDGQNDCPDLEKMRAYGECQWYRDQEYHHGATPAVAAAVATGDAVSAPAVEDVKAATEAVQAAEAPSPSAVVGPSDCWYDGATDEYYHFEFSNADANREETSAATTEAVESDAAEEMDSAAAETSHDTDCNADESYVEKVCREPATEAVSEAQDAATEDAWRSDYGHEDAYPSEGTAYPYGTAADAEMAAPKTAAQETSIEDLYVGEAGESNQAGDSDEDGAWDEGATEEYADSSDEMDDSSRLTEQAADDTEFTEDSEESMETTWDETKTAVPSAESPEVCPSHEYDYKYGGAPYRYESYEPTYSEPSYSAPVQAWEDADVEVVEGEDSEAAVPAAPPSETVEFDSEIILSLARTLDRVGSTLQCLSQYLTEMATADLAKRHGETIER